MMLVRVNLSLIRVLIDSSRTCILKERPSPVIILGASRRLEKLNAECTSDSVVISTWKGL